MFQVDRPTASIGSSDIVYVSIPSDSPTCVGLGLPALPPGWTYACRPTASHRNIDGTGWIPVNFTTMSQGSPLSHLPIDPTNTAVSGNYYTYVVGAGWELNTIFESNKYRNDTSVAKQNLPGVFAIGTNLSLSPIYNNSGLVGYWSFDEGTGTTARDLSGGGNTGTLINNPTWVEGRVGRALSFDGVDDFVLIPGSTSLDTPSALTVEAWIKDLSTSNNHSLNKDEGGTNRVWIVRREDDTRVNWHVWNSAGTFQILVPANSWTMGEWFHIICTAEVIDGNIKMKVYFNGQMKGTNIFPGTAIRVITAQGIRLSLSKRQKLDEVRIHNRALSAAEVMAIFNATR